MNVFFLPQVERPAHGIHLVGTGGIQIFGECYSSETGLSRFDASGITFRQGYVQLSTIDIRSSLDQ